MTGDVSICKTTYALNPRPHCSSHLFTGGALQIERQQGGEELVVGDGGVPVVGGEDGGV